LSGISRAQLSTELFDAFATLWRELDELLSACQDTKELLHVPRRLGKPGEERRAFLVAIQQRSEPLRGVLGYSEVIVDA
jgi:hypothetical protein